MEPLTGLDASFLYLEQPHLPMHVGGVLVLEGSLKFPAFRDAIASRIHLVPRMRQRLVHVPLGLGNPYWIDDPSFDLDLHLQHIALPRPGGWRQLRELANRIFALPLPRNRALWEFAFVEGLDTIAQVPSGSVALITRVHHAAIDGVSGADMLGLLFDLTPKPRAIEPPPPRVLPPKPNELSVLATALRDLARKPRMIPGLVRGGWRAMRAGSSVRAEGLEPPPAPYSAPRSAINQTVSSKRLWNTALLSLDRVKAIKTASGGTLNDVVLAICAGALRRHLGERNELPDEPLVAMMPMSTRTSAGKGAMGNQVTAALVQLATHIEDPIERLEMIRRGTGSGKSYQSAIGARSLQDFAEFVPFGLAGPASRLYTRFRVAEKLRPVFNVVITNVPGPQTDLYIAGHKLLANMGMAPILDGMGLIITVLSYNGVISLSPMSSPAVMPDLDRFARQLRESANELEAAVAKLKPRAAPAQTIDLAAATHEFFHRVRDKLERAAAPGSGTFQFRVTGSPGANWIVALGDRTVTEGEASAPSATFTVRNDHLAQILRGELDPQMAFVQGKLQVKGDVAQAAALGKLMPS